jgi:hypothetical protein
MHEDDGSSPFQFVEQGTKSRVAEIDSARVAEQNDAVQLEDIQPVFKRAQCAVDVGKRQCREPAETVRTVLDQLCRELVDAARQIIGGSIITHMDARALQPFRTPLLQQKHQREHCGRQRVQHRATAEMTARRATEP